MQVELEAILRYQFSKPFCDQCLKSSAQAVAIWRAVHQLLEQPPIFQDAIAIKILGELQHTLVNQLNNHSDMLSTALRIAVAARSRLAEDEREKSDATQYVILGAGLDTYAYRKHLKLEIVFEVDLPEVQEYKKTLLNNNAINPTTQTLYVPCNFEQNSLKRNLLSAGFDPTKKTFFSWLGVVPYLTQTAIDQTLGFILECAPGSEVVFDYIVAPNLLTDVERWVLELLGAQLAAGNEPIQTFYAPQEMCEHLSRIGFSRVIDIDANTLNQRYLARRKDGLQVGRVSRMVKLEV